MHLFVFHLLHVQSPTLDFFTKEICNLLLKHPRRKREMMMMIIIYYVTTEPYPPVGFSSPRACKYEVERQRAKERAGSCSPPRAGLLRLGTKALFSFIFTAALQSGSCFLPGAVAPDLALGESPAFHIHLSTVSLCSPLGSCQGSPASPGCCHGCRAVAKSSN